MRLIDADDLTMQMIANFQQAMWGGADSDECQLALDTIAEALTALTGFGRTTPRSGNSGCTDALPILIPANNTAGGGYWITLGLSGNLSPAPWWGKL